MTKTSTRFDRGRKRIAEGGKPCGRSACSVPIVLDSSMTIDARLEKQDLFTHRMDLWHFAYSHTPQVRKPVPP